MANHLTIERLEGYIEWVKAGHGFVDELARDECLGYLRDALEAEKYIVKLEAERDAAIKNFDDLQQMRHLDYRRREVGEGYCSIVDDKCPTPAESCDDCTDKYRETEMER